jgi:uncharacterized protein involved in exopolysaccharide biosynthesis
MNNKKQQKGYNFNSVDLLIYIWNKRIILAAIGFLAGVVSIVISLMITPMFQSKVIMFPASNASVSKDLLSQNYSGRQNVHGFGEEEQAEQLLQILNSEPIRTRIIEKYNLMEHYEIEADAKYPLTELYSRYRSNINFRLTEYMSVEISVMDRDPDYAANMANDISYLVDTVYNSMKKERAREALRLVEREYKEAAQNLAVLRDSLNLFSRQLSSESSRGGDPGSNLLMALSQNGAHYLSMHSLVRAEAQLVSELSLRYKEARLEAEQNLSHKFVVDMAFPSEKKAYPKKSLIVIVSTLASLLFALIVLIIVDNIRDRVAIREEK